MSKEYTTVDNCILSLETALKKPERETVHFLKHEGFITGDTHDVVLNAQLMLTQAQKATTMVGEIKDRISDDPDSYETLHTHLKKYPKYNLKGVVKKLNKEHARLSGNCDAAGNTNEAGGGEYPNSDGGVSNVGTGSRVEHVQSTSPSLLGIDDKRAVLSEVGRVASRWEDFGLALDLKQDTLDQVRSDNAGSSSRLSAVISEWLRGNGGKRTWK